MSYRAPLADMEFTLNELAGLPAIAALPGYEEATPDLVASILSESGKFTEEVLAPLNHTGHKEGSVFENGVVRTPQGFQDAYLRFVEAGWNSLPFDPDYGGQGMPWTLATAIQEMWHASNMSFGLCPLLTQGAVELLQTHGTEAQKETYLPKMVAGEWTGTMNLTEPQAGSDVGALKTRAVPNGDHYLITGQKIYITWGEHDCADNIIHMVLARTPDAPEGTRGISLFLVPKYLVRQDGSLGPRNDLRCASLEHKLGIMASPTAVMAYGDSGGAVGYLVGEENHGMQCMFTMMNNARLAVGLQGVAIAERAYQQARDFAKERVQSRAVGSNDANAVTIINHPDVRRSLMTMKAMTEAARALAYVTAAALDGAKRNPNEAARRAAQSRLDLLIPVTKSWCTEIGCEVASMGVQVHGGMGFIEETGAAQHYRDARILPIYEGTNGIQAMDLLSRKLLRDGGAAARTLIQDMESGLAEIAKLPGGDGEALSEELVVAIKELESVTEWLVTTANQDIVAGASAASPYQRLLGTVTGGWLLARLAVTAGHHLEEGIGNRSFLAAKIKTARFYADNILPQAAGLGAAVVRGAKSVMSLEEDQF